MGEGVTVYGTRLLTVVHPRGGVPFAKTDQLLREGSRHGEVLKVYDVEGIGLTLLADIVSRQVVCFH